MAGETGGQGGGQATAPLSGNNIPGGFLGSISGAGPLAQVSNPGTRARLSDFGTAMNQGGMAPLPPPEQRLPVADRERFADALGGGEDAQAQALAFEDSSQSDVLDGEEANVEMDERSRRWMEWENDDNLPEPLFQKFVTVVTNGERYRVPVSEAVNGFMMQADYSEKLRQVYELRDQIVAKDRNLQQFLSALKSNGQSFLDMIAYMGQDFFRSFAEAAIIYGTQLDAEQKMSPEQREVVGRERAARQRAHDLEIRLKQLEQQLQQQTNPQASRTEQYYMTQLSQMIPLAQQRLQRMNLEWVASPFSQSVWEKHWNQMFPAIEGKDLSTEHVMNVFMAAIQEIRQLTKAGHIQVPPRTAAGQLPPNSGMSGAVQPPMNGQNGRRAKRERISDLGRMVTR